MADEHIFESATDLRFKIGAQALMIMQEYAQDRPSLPEAGGVLLGRLICGTSDYVVDRITAPMEGDEQRKSRFHRDRKSHQQVVDYVWMESAGTCNYQGEWHTHPEAKPYPSRFDVLSWRRILTNSQYFSPYLFFVIVGWEEIGVWCGGKTMTTIEKLERFSPMGKQMSYRMVHE